MHELNKFGDQKYLEQLSEFSSVKILKHLGTIGPWNMNNYDYYLKNGESFGVDLQTKMEFELIFFHFHAFKFLRKNKYINLGVYIIPKSAFKIIYPIYTRKLLKMNIMLNKDFEIRSIDDIIPLLTWKSPLRYIKRILVGIPLVISLRKLLNEEPNLI